MTITQLKKKWGKYCDIQVLYDDICATLDKNGQPHEPQGVGALINEYFKNKEPLIQMFQTSGHYIGDMRIAIDAELARTADARAIRLALRNMSSVLNMQQLLQYCNENEQTLCDCLMCGKNVVSLSDIESEKTKLAQTQLFDFGTLATLKSVATVSSINNYFIAFENRTLPVLSTNMDIDDTLTIHAGTKTSRAFNAICTHYGVDKLGAYEQDGKTVYPYNKLFAEYSDLINTKTVKRKLVISLNPLDYLTMSDGVNWHSCHKLNGGIYKGGTLSYMLDQTSMVVFVVDNLESKIHTIPKIYRQMFHYADNTFVQSRLYPQGNDGATDLYTVFRNYVIGVFKDILHVDGEWVVENNENNAVARRIRSYGAHYRDYNYHSSVTIFYPKATGKSATQMVVGHEGICLKCGKSFTENGRLSHSRCGG